MEKKINVQNTWTYFMFSSIFGLCNKINERGYMPIRWIAVLLV